MPKTNAQKQADFRARRADKITHLQTELELTQRSLHLAMTVWFFGSERPRPILQAVIQEDAQKELFLTEMLKNES